MSPFRSSVIKPKPETLADLFDANSMRKIYALRAAKFVSNDVKDCLTKLAFYEGTIPKTFRELDKVMSKNSRLFELCGDHDVLPRQVWTGIVAEAAKNDVHLEDWVSAGETNFYKDTFAEDINSLEIKKFPNLAILRKYYVCRAKEHVSSEYTKVILSKLLHGQDGIPHSLTEFVQHLKIRYGIDKSSTIHAVWNEILNAVADDKHFYAIVLTHEPVSVEDKPEISQDEVIICCNNSNIASKAYSIISNHNEETDRIPHASRTETSMDSASVQSHQLCIYFIRDGFCPNGFGCDDVHQNPTLFFNQRPDNTAPLKERNFVHTRPNKRICFNLIDHGFCTFKRCRYIHPSYFAKPLSRREPAKPYVEQWLNSQSESSPFGNDECESEQNEVVVCLDDESENENFSIEARESASDEVPVSHEEGRPDVNVVMLSCGMDSARPSPELSQGCQ